LKSAELVKQNCLQWHHKRLTDINKAYFDLNIGKFESGAKDLAELLPKKPSQFIQLPSLFNVNGYFKGTINNFPLI
jgi:hypothetical protein